MRPTELTICGWGPYKEENKIDFTKLGTGNLFLITGQTGAGKTTIFDAITYALYGTLSGGIREKGSVRSDFADENTKTYVKLTMTHKHETYMITRNPEYSRPKKKKSGSGDNTKEKENAVLTLPDGTIIAGNNDVTRKIQEILCMDANQFRQISMIAQGEFARLIFASPSEKTAIFRELFQTGQYASIQSLLKEKAATLYKEFMIYKNKMDENIHMLHIEDELWKELTEKDSIQYGLVEEKLGSFCSIKNQELTKWQDKLKQKENDISSLQEKRTIALQENKRFQEYDGLTKRLQELEEKSIQIDIQKRKMNRAKSALTLSYEEKSVNEQKLLYEKTHDSLNKTIQNKEQTENAMEELQVVINYQNAFEEGYRLKETSEELQKKLEDINRLAGSKQTELVKLQAEYVKQQDKTDYARQVYEKADSCYKRAVVGVVARMLEEGKPCPVCGSASHPHIASIADDIPREEELEQLKKEYEDIAQKCSVLFQAALQKKNETESLTQQAEEQSKLLLSINTEYDKLPEIVKQHLALAEYHRKELFDKKCKQFDEYQGMLTALNTRADEYKEELSRYLAALNEKREAFLSSLKKEGFLDEQEYKAARLSAEEITEGEQDILNFERDYAAAKEMHAHLKEQLTGRKRMDELPIIQQLEDCAAKKKELEQTIKELYTAVCQMKAAKAAIHEKRIKAEKLAGQYGIWKDLDDLANGNNRKRLVFEQYVLLGYFENILQAANKRLKMMTEGRYELRRATAISDGRKKDSMEITVMDYYTGKMRSVKTLSGGEIFKASLALALGLSDCIQIENGGIQVETLFVDEGFGALDEESLEQACNTLQSLAEKNRMIGIISHVPELRERIEHQIIVEKRNNGSFISFCN